MLGAVHEVHTHFDRYYAAMPPATQKLVDAIAATPLEQCSHVLFYGPPGGMVYELARHSIVRRFGVPYPLKYSTVTVPVSGNHPFELVYKLCTATHSLEVDLTPHGPSDKLALSEVLKPIMSQRSMDTVARHIVFIQNVDRLSELAKLALRRMMETYAPTSLLVMTASQIGHVPVPLRSRMWLVRCPELGAEAVGRVMAMLPAPLTPPVPPGAQGAVGASGDLYATLLASHPNLLQEEVGRAMDSIRRCKTPWVALGHAREMLTKVYPYLTSDAVFFRMVLKTFESRPDYNLFINIAAEANHQIATSHRPLFAIEAALLKMYAVVKKIT
jgi:hypothetical protein